MPNKIPAYTYRGTSAVRPVTIATIVAFVIFCALVLFVSSGASSSFDETLMLALRETGDASNPLGPDWFEETAADWTALGGYPLLVPIIGISIIGLYLLDTRQASLFLALAVGSGAVVSSLLKEVFSHPRPDLVDHGDKVFTSSFPSAHAMVSAVAWMTLAAVLVRFVPRRRISRFMLGVAATISIVVGVSRVYLGVHWPTDVLAGWSVGFAWAGLCWLIAHRLQQGDEVEADLGTDKA